MTDKVQIQSYLLEALGAIDTFDWSAGTNAELGRIRGPLRCALSRLEAQAAIDYENGHVRAREGAERFDNPYPTGKPGHADWDRGWCDGQTRAAGEQPTPPECPARKALEQVVPYMQKRANELAALCGDRPSYTSPDAERYFRNAGASTAIHNLANEVGSFIVNESTPCSSCQTYSGMTQDGLDGAIAYDALLAERDALTRKVENLLEALEESNKANWVLAYDTSRGARLRAAYEKTARHVAELLSEHEKEQG